MEPRIIIKYCREDLEVTLQEAREIWGQLDKIFGNTSKKEYVPVPYPTYAPMPQEPYNPFKIEREKPPTVWCGGGVEILSGPNYTIHKNDGHYGIPCKDGGNE